MADVFISYKSEDRDRVALVAQGLQAEGFDVWWDSALQGGETYDEVIEKALHDAKVVVVLWSPRSVTSRWVRSEATVGDRQGKLVPATIEPCERPIAFELAHTATLDRWTGDPADPEWRRFVEDVRARRDGLPVSRQPVVPRPPPPLSPVSTGSWLWVPVTVVLGVIGVLAVASVVYSYAAMVESVRKGMPSGIPSFGEAPPTDLGRFVGRWSSNGREACRQAAVTELEGKTLTLTHADGDVEEHQITDLQVGGKLTTQTSEDFRFEAYQLWLSDEDQTLHLRSLANVEPLALAGDEGGRAWSRCP